MSFFENEQERKATESQQPIFELSGKGGMLGVNLTIFCGPPARFPSSERLNSEI